MPVAAYAKAIVAVIGVAILAVQAALEDGIFTTDEWFPIVIAVVTALSVYFVPNKPTQ